MVMVKVKEIVEVADEEEAEGSDEGAPEHAAGLGDADEDAVDDEGSDATDGDEDSPGQILLCCEIYLLVIGEDMEEHIASEGVGHGEGCGEQERPLPYTTMGEAETLTVACSVVLATERLSGIGEAVDDIGVEYEHLHDDGVDGEYVLTATGADDDEVEVDGNEEEGAQEEVAIDGEEASQLAKPYGATQTDTPPHIAIAP